MVVLDFLQSILKKCTYLLYYCYAFTYNCIIISHEVCKILIVKQFNTSLPF